MVIFAFDKIRGSEFFLYTLYIMSKSKRQVKRRMSTKKRRVVRRKTQKRKQTKRRGGEFFKRPPLPKEKTYRSLSADAAGPTLLGTEIDSSETQRKSSLSSYNPFSRPSTQLSDPETTIVGIESMSLDEINKMIENIQRNPETEVLKNKLKQLQDMKMKIQSSPSVSFETKKRPGSFGLPFFKR